MVGVTPSTAARRISSRKKAIYSLVVAITVFGMLESSARVNEIWMPPLRVDYGLGFDANSRLFQVDPSNPAMLHTAPDKLSNFLAQEFPAQKPSGALRVAVLGGSSVYQLKNELDELKSRLSDQFSGRFENIEIINAGGLAYGSHRLVPILLELFEYDLDLVIIYTGHNEFEEVEQLELANLQLLTVNRGLAHFASVRFIRDCLARAKIRQLKAEHNHRIMASDNRPFGANYVRSWQHRWTREEVDDRMNHFRQNLLTLIQLCRTRNIPVVMGTVPSNLVRPALAENVTPEIREKYQAALDNYSRGNFSEAQNMVREILQDSLGRHQSSDRENGIIRNLALQHQVPLADVEKAVMEHEPHGVPGMTLFLDHCHLNIHGRRIWRETFEREMISLIGQ